MDFDSLKPIKPKQEDISIPTGDRRHVSWVREGKQSAEVFARSHKRRIELGLPIIQMESDNL